MNLGFNPPKTREDLPLHATPTVLHLLQHPVRQLSVPSGTDDDTIEMRDPLLTRQPSSPEQLATANTSSEPALPNAQDVDTQDTILDTQDS